MASNETNPTIQVGISMTTDQQQLVRLLLLGAGVHGVIANQIKRRKLRQLTQLNRDVLAHLEAAWTREIYLNHVLLRNEVQPTEFDMIVINDLTHDLP